MRGIVCTSHITCSIWFWWAWYSTYSIASPEPKLTYSITGKCHNVTLSRSQCADLLFIDFVTQSTTWLELKHSNHSSHKKKQNECSLRGRWKERKCWRKKQPRETQRGWVQYPMAIHLNYDTEGEWVVSKIIMVPSHFNARLNGHACDRSAIQMISHYIYLCLL